MTDTPLPLDDLALDEIPNGQELYALVKTSALLVLRSRSDLSQTQVHQIASRIAERTLRERNRARAEESLRRQAIKQRQSK